MTTLYTLRQRLTDLLEYERVFRSVLSEYDKDELERHKARILNEIKDREKNQRYDA